MRSIYARAALAAAFVTLIAGVASAHPSITSPMTEPRPIAERWAPAAASG